MFFSFYTAKKQRTKRKSSSQRTIRATLTPCLRIASAGKQGSRLRSCYGGQVSGPALRFSLPSGLSELGLWPALKHADKLLTAVNCDAH
jgi:hypothetical protein